MRVKEVIQAMQSILDQTPKIEANELIDQLVAAGFKITEIESAFELIYKLPDILSFEKTNDLSARAFRVYNMDERTRLSLDTQGYLWQLLNSDLIDTDEFEYLIIELLSFNIPEITRVEVNIALRQVINDPIRSALLATTFTKKEQH